MLITEKTENAYEREIRKRSWERYNHSTVSTSQREYHLAFHVCFGGLQSMTPPTSRPPTSPMFS